MQLSIFEVLGPVMIGPSSSHTAGAAKLARVAAVIAAKPFYKVTFGLAGSFAQTGLGHGTHKALLAGAMGLAQDDERIRDIDALAQKAGIQAVYYEEDLDWMHENSVHITFYHADDTSEVWGSSIGGGRIEVRRIGRQNVTISAESPTLVIQHMDRPGVVSEVSRVLAQNGVNIAVMRLAREERGRHATVVMEVDGHLPQGLAARLEEIEHVEEVILIDVPQL